MLEISVFCVILLAAFYWTAMYVMGRRDDVIHGKFVHADDEGALPPAMLAPPMFPKRPVKVAASDAHPVKAEARPVNSDALQSLLAAIQQDLKSVA